MQLWLTMSAARTILNTEYAESFLLELPEKGGRSCVWTLYVYGPR